VTDPYLSYNIFAIDKQLVSSASLIMGMSGKSISAIYATYCFNKAMLCLGINDVAHVSEEYSKSLDGEMKISEDRVPYGHFPVEFHVVSNIFMGADRGGGGGGGKLNVPRAV
jgi:hypothetical protein